MASPPQETDPFIRHLVLLADAPDRGRHALAWAFDRRLADAVRSTRDPALGQMRMAWWDEALTGDGSKGGGEPLVAAMRAAWPDAADRARMTRVIDGWEALMLAERLDEAAMSAFAAGRGALFGLLGETDWLGPAGEGWALWDLSGHVSDPQAAGLAARMAGERLERVPRRGWPRRLRPLRVVVGLARGDARRGRPSPGRLTPGQYLRLLGLSLTGGG